MGNKGLENMTCVDAGQLCVQSGKKGWQSLPRRLKRQIGRIPLFSDYFLVPRYLHYFRFFVSDTHMRTTSMHLTCSVRDQGKCIMGI